jgi:leucine efflux protein
VGFTVASVAIVLAPGPNSVFVAKTAGGGGARKGYMAMLGILSGDTCLITLSLLGVSTLLRMQPVLFHTMRLAGAAYLIFLGLQAILARPKEDSTAVPDAAPPFQRAVTISLLNPKAILFFMAFFPTCIVSPGDGLAATYAVMTLFFQIISATYLCTLVHVSAHIGRAFQESPKVRLIARRVCGCVFIGFGVKVAALVSG